MIRAGFIAVVSFMSLATVAQASVVAERAQLDQSAIVQVGEGCGGGMWRGPRGGCNPFNSPYGNNRGRTFECPVGWHFVPGGPGRCFPDR